MTDQLRIAMASGDVIQREWERLEAYRERRAAERAREWRRYDKERERG